MNVYVSTFLSCDIQLKWKWFIQNFILHEHQDELRTSVIRRIEFCSWNKTSQKQLTFFLHECMINIFPGFVVGRRDGRKILKNQVLSLLYVAQSGPGCSKLMTSLVNVSLKFQTLTSKLIQYFLLKKMWKAFAVQKLLTFFNKSISMYLVIKS